MISSLRLNKLILSVIFFTALTFNSSFAEDEAVDIWEKQEDQNEQNNQTNAEQDLTIESPILSDDINKIVIKIDEISIKRLNLGLNDIKSRSRDMIQLAEMSLFYCSKFPLSISKKAKKYIKKVDKNVFKELLIVLENIENDFKKKKIEEIISKFLGEKGLKLSDIIQYIRAMITGLDVSPRIYDIMEILGFVEIKKRIENFING